MESEARGETTGCSKRSPARPEGAKPPERTLVREEAKRLRTPLVAFFSVLLGGVIQYVRDTLCRREHS